MIFQDGELRQVESNRPMLFDGWAYVPMESKSVTVEEQLIAENDLTKRDAPSEPSFK